MRQGAAGPGTEVQDWDHGLGACGGCGAGRAQCRAVPDPTTPGQGRQWLSAPVRLRDAPAACDAAGRSARGGGAVFGHCGRTETGSGIRCVIRRVSTRRKEYPGNAGCI